MRQNLGKVCGPGWAPHCMESTRIFQNGLSSGWVSQHGIDGGAAAGFIGGMRRAAWTAPAGRYVGSWNRDRRCGWSCRKGVGAECACLVRLK